MTHARLPAAPLRRVLLRLRDAESLTWEELADRAGLSSRHLFRLLAARTVSELVADRISCRIGLHPALLWPKEWFRQEQPRRRGSSNAKRAV
jgi:AraC-like DNA-binding protein